MKDLIQYLQEKVIGAIYIGSTIPQTKIYIANYHKIFKAKVYRKIICYFS